MIPPDVNRGIWLSVSFAEHFAPYLLKKHFALTITNASTFLRPQLLRTGNKSLSDRRIHLPSPPYCVGKIGIRKNKESVGPVALSAVGLQRGSLWFNGLHFPAQKNVFIFQNERISKVGAHHCEDWPFIPPARAAQLWKKKIEI